MTEIRRNVIVQRMVTFEFSIPEDCGSSDFALIENRDK